jgi:hypothetical protein
MATDVSAPQRPVRTAQIHPQERRWVRPAIVDMDWARHRLAPRA